MAPFAVARTVPAIRLGRSETRGTSCGLLQWGCRSDNGPLQPGDAWLPQTDELRWLVERMGQPQRFAGRIVGALKGLLHCPGHHLRNLAYLTLLAYTLWRLTS